MIIIFAINLLFAECASFIGEIYSTSANVESDIYETQILIDMYLEYMGKASDPFATTKNFEEIELVHSRLLVRTSNSKVTDSPLAAIRGELAKNHLGKPVYNRKLVHALLNDIEKIPISITDAQSNLLALHKLLQYCKKFSELEFGHEFRTVNFNRYPILPKVYHPFSKDVNIHKYDEKSATKIAQVNTKTSFFVQRYYRNITRGSRYPFQDIDLPISKWTTTTKTSSRIKEVIYPLGAKQLDIFIPIGYTALPPENPKAVLIRMNNGSYRLTLKEDLTEVVIPLVPEKGIKLMPHIRDLYTIPVGFTKEEFPEEFNVAIFQKYSPKRSPLVIAKAVAKFISTNYLYSTKGNDITDPIKSLQETGTLQCDMADYLMIGILRDVYKIPCRIAAGFIAKNSKKDTGIHSHLMLPSSPHVIVEVFDEKNGRWVPFDPTPIRRDDESINNTGNIDYRNVAL